MSAGTRHTISSYRVRLPRTSALLEARRALTRGAVWWLHPMWAIGVIVVPSAIGAFLIPAQDYLANWGTPKYFEPAALVLVLGAAVALALPSLVVAALSRRNEPDSEW